MPDRHGPLRTGMGQFIASVNGGDIGNGAVAVPLDSDVWGEYAVDSEVSLAGVVPTGARGGEGINPEDVMLLAEIGAEEVTYNLESSGAFFPGSEWFPGSSWVPGDSWVPGNEWIPGSDWVPDDPEDIGVLVPNIEGTMERIGMEELPEDAEIVEEGNTVGGLPLLTAIFGDPELYPEGTNEASYPPETSPELPEEPIFSGETLFPDDPFAPDLFDAGVQAPIGGAGFGMGVLSTPSATVAGQDANPIIQVSSEDLLTRDETANLLSNAGISDAENIEWEAGPESVSAESDYETPTLLGEEVELELFGGVVSGGEAPWGVTLGIARGTPDDHIIAIGLNRRPVGTAEGGLEAVQNDQHVVDNMALMLAETVPDLESG